MIKANRKQKFKSKFEKYVAKQLEELKIPLQYEADVLHYIVPEKKHRYYPDFKVRENFYIESKGIFDYKDRQKMLLVKEQYPKVRICIVFYNARQRLSKLSRTTYAEWCDKNGIQWSHRIIKKEWLNEAV